ncbi:hypothetical protein [Marivirga sp.]|uniref:hypothetical protein n=1 Tax=Marivirga sp. TaxID=2018662 RepID=UPI002D80D561|nr:hypothetical protein [Marivirga sp.]HET8860503.1 hypothetical protein [Marivirga sp.]
MGKIICLCLVLFLSFKSEAQKTFISVGYSDSRLQESYFYTPRGTNLSISYDVVFFKSKFKSINSINVSFLFSEMDSEFLPAYTTVLSVSPKLGFDILQFGRFRITPFFGPFGAWVAGIETETILNQVNVRNEFRYGFDTGLIVDVRLKENCVLRVIPWSLQYGNDFFRQGIIQIGLNLN